MHTEHLQNVRPLRVLAGWTVAVAVTSFIVLALAAIGLTGPDPTLEAIGSTISIALGFWVGGLSISYGAFRAPILHGIMIGLTTLFAWFALNIVGLFIPTVAWEGLSPTLTAALLVVQMAAAVGGTLVGYRFALRGAEALTE